MIVFLFEREQEDEFHGISQNKIKIVIYTKKTTKRLTICGKRAVGYDNKNTTKRLRICGKRALGYDNKVKDSF